MMNYEPPVKVIFEYLGYRITIRDGVIEVHKLNTYQLSDVVNAFVALGWLIFKGKPDSILSLSSENFKRHPLPRNKNGSVDPMKAIARLDYIINVTRAGYRHSDAIFLLDSGVDVEAVIAAAGENLDIEMLFSLI